MINLYDKVRIIKTGEIGYVVDISNRQYLIIERDESDSNEERLKFDVKVEDVEKIGKG